MPRSTEGMAQARNWCFTINNPTREPRFNEDKMVYLVFGRETGEEFSTPHLQGFVQLISKMRLSAVKNLLGGEAHLEVARGTATQAADYCKKDGDYEEHGSIRLTANEQRKVTRKEACSTILALHRQKKAVRRLWRSFLTMRGMSSCFQWRDTCREVPSRLCFIFMAKPAVGRHTQPSKCCSA